MKRKWLEGRENFLMVILLIFVSAITYLPHLREIGYLNDDWYLMYAANTYGSHVFVDIFSGDRPLRALVMIPAYEFFGDNVLYYNLSAYLFRLISALSFLWFLQMLWPDQNNKTFFAALLFLVYPGFLSQINGIDYQSQMVSLAAAMISLSLTLHAVLSKRHVLIRTCLITLSVVLGWFYLSLVEYFLGFEFLRFGALAILGFRENPDFPKRLIGSIRLWVLNLITPLGFLIWRIFFFESNRGATDIGRQVSGFFESPLLIGFWWVTQLAMDSLDVLFLAWGVPFSGLFFALRPRQILTIFAFSVLTIVLLYKIFFSAPPHSSQAKTLSNSFNNYCYWHREMLFIGFGMIIAGLFPVILVNRQVEFFTFSRYTLASSAGVSLVLIVMIFHYILSSQLRGGLLFSLFLVSVLTHHANAEYTARKTQALRNFWWQVSWRIPQLREQTTLIANYPLGGIEEDYFVWGPANLIYYPTIMHTDRINIALPAAVLNKNTLLSVISSSGQQFTNRRSIETTVDFGNVLIFTQPSEISCVQIIDGRQPEVSMYEDTTMMIIAPYSNIDNIDINADFPVPSQLIFGPEPDHDWCYYYEKASLARQRGDWDEVLRLGDEALENDFVALDEIEWIPFLQAYAQNSDIERLTEIKRQLRNADSFVINQICYALLSMDSLPTSIIDSINEFYCGLN